MILIVLPYVGKRFDDLDSSALENLRITDPRSLQDQWCAYRTCRNNYLLRGADFEFITMTRLECSPIRLGIATALNPDGSLVVVEQHADDLRLDEYMQIGILSTL